MTSRLAGIISFARRDGHKFYPILLGLFPLLSFWAANQSEIRSGGFNIGIFLFFNLIVIAAVWLVSWVVMRDARRAALLATAGLVLFFVFGRLQAALGDFVINTPGTPLGPAKLTTLISLAVLAASWYGIRRLPAASLKKFSLALSAVGLYLVVSSLATILWPYLTEPAAKPANVVATTKTQAKSKPDIYYIMLDGYARADILKNNFGYDNSGFIKALAKRGFYVASQSNANYAHTHFSAPSTFNMKYLNYLATELGETSTNRAPLQALTKRHQAATELKALGYKYAVIGTQWSWATDSPQADLKISSSYQDSSKILGIELDEFGLVYLQTTALRPWVAKSIQGSMLNKILGAYERTERISQLPEATFSFTHILAPHPPYLFDRHGPIKGLTDELALDNPGFSNKKGFVEQTIYINKLTLELIDKILKNSSQPPIIILASDHGPASTLGSKDFAASDPAKLNLAGVKERLANLNAYYFPDQNYSKLYPEITPVNSFRLVLNQYFGLDYKLLPDRSYFSDNKQNEYRFLDVTNLVKQR